MEITDLFDRKIRFTDERRNHILKRGEMKNQTRKIIETLKKPDIVITSSHDRSVLLYHKFYAKTPVGEKYLLVGVKMLVGDAFLITAFFTDKVKKGEIHWKKN